MRLWLQEVERALHDVSQGDDVDSVRERIATLQRRIDRGVAAIMNGTESPTLTEALRAAEAEKRRLTEHLAARAAPEPARALGDTVLPAVEDFARMLEDLPGKLGAPRARQVIAEWMRNVRLVPGANGELSAHWEFNGDGLLVAAGPRTVALLTAVAASGSGGRLQEVTTPRAQSLRIR